METKLEITFEDSFCISIPVGNIVIEIIKKQTLEVLVK